MHGVKRAIYGYLIDREQADSDANISKITRNYIYD